MSAATTALERKSVEPAEETSEAAFFALRPAAVSSTLLILESVDDSDADGEAEPVREADGDALSLSHAAPVGVTLGDAPREIEDVGVPVLLCVGVAVKDPVPVGVDVEVDRGVHVGDPAAVDVVIVLPPSDTEGVCETDNAGCAPAADGVNELEPDGTIPVVLEVGV